MVDSKGLEGLAIGIAEEPAVVAALEDEERVLREGWRWDGREKSYTEERIGEWKDLLYRPRHSRQRLKVMAIQRKNLPQEDVSH